MLQVPANDHIKDPINIIQGYDLLNRYCDPTHEQVSARDPKVSI